MLLCGWQTQVGAIATGKARIADLHLLAFHIAGQAADKHHHISRVCGIHGVSETVLGARHAPRQTHFRITRLFKVFQTNLAGLARMQLHHGAFALQTRRGLPGIQHQLIINE